MAKETATSWIEVDKIFISITKKEIDKLTQSLVVSDRLQPQAEAIFDFLFTNLRWRLFLLIYLSDGFFNLLQNAISHVFKQLFTYSYASSGQHMQLSSARRCILDKDLISCLLRNLSSSVLDKPYTCLDYTELLYTPIIKAQFQHCLCQNQKKQQPQISSKYADWLCSKSSQLCSATRQKVNQILQHQANRKISMRLQL